MKKIPYKNIIILIILFFSILIIIDFLSRFLLLKAIFKHEDLYTLNNIDLKKEYYSSFYDFNMIDVPGGSFILGCKDVGAIPEYQVRIDNFKISNYEITCDKWVEIKSWSEKIDYIIHDNADSLYGAPATNISWYDVVKWCNAYSEYEGLKPCYYTDPDKKVIYKSGIININNNCVDWESNGYRLPTEAEWEYASRYIDGKEWRKGNKYSGSDIVNGVAFFKDNSGNENKIVGLLKPNQLGIYDMSGNVWEWCWDWYTGKYESGENNPKGSNNGIYRVMRGGSAACERDACEVSRRGYENPGINNNYIGFRVVKRN